VILLVLFSTEALAKKLVLINLCTNYV